MLDPKGNQHSIIVNKEKTRCETPSEFESASLWCGGIVNKFATTSVTQATNNEKAALLLVNPTVEGVGTKADGNIFSSSRGPSKIA